MCEYFQYQLRNQSLPSDVDPLNPAVLNVLQKSISNYITIASIIPLTLANFANLLFMDYVSAHLRLVVTSVVMLAMFIITAVLSKSTIGKAPLSLSLSLEYTSFRYQCIPHRYIDYGGYKQQ